MDSAKPVPATRVRLINAASFLMAERTFTAAGVEDLCRLAGAKKGSFYHFFPTKVDLALAAVASQWDTIRDQIFEPVAQDGTAGLDRLSRLVDRLDAMLRQQRSGSEALLGCPFGNLGQEMAHQDDRIRLAIQTVFDAQCHFLRLWLDEAVRARQVIPGDTASRARQLLGLIEGAFLLAKVSGDPDVFGDVCKALPALAGRGAPPAAASMAAIPELD